MRKNKISMAGRYLFYSFLIAWGAEFVLILFYRMNVLRGVAMQIMHFGVIGFGAGMAPAYAAFIVEKKQNGITLKEFIKKIFSADNYRKSLFILILFGGIQFCVCALQENYLGYPWYFFILFMPMMILGGGLEEVGWQGVFQPLLQKRFPFLLAAVMEGIVWSVWHLPLWLVPNTTQSSYSFTAFTFYCITLGITLAAAHKITKGIWVSILLHAWGNTVLGGMYSLTMLCNFPDWKTILIGLVQIAVVVSIMYCHEKGIGKR